MRTIRRWLPAAGVVLVAVAGLILRGWLLSSPLGRVDSDEAVTGLMARHFLRGEWTTFYWGSNYGGAIESILAAPLTPLCNSAVVMKALTILLYAVALALTWRVGRRTVGDRAGLVGALLLWVAPAAFVLISTKTRGWYGVALILGLTAMLLALRLAEDFNPRLLAVLGLTLGLALWTSPLALALVLPPCGWLVACRPSVLRHIWLAVPGAALGSAPWWAYNIHADWVGLQGGAAPLSADYLSHLRGFFTDLLPRSLGLRLTYSGQWLGGPVAQAAYVVLIVLFAVYTVRTFRSGGSNTLLVAVVLPYPLLFSLAEVSFYTAEPRYGLPLGPVLALLLAHGLLTLVARTWAVGAVLGGVVLATVVSLNLLLDWSEDNPGHLNLTAPELSPLVEYLSRAGVDAVYAQYWISYALAAVTDEEIVATPFVRAEARYEPYEREVKARTGAAVYVLFQESSEHDAFRSRLDQFRLAHRRDDVASFAVYWLDPPPDLPDKVFRAPP